MPVTKHWIKLPSSKTSNSLTKLTARHISGKCETRKAKWFALMEVSIGHVDRKQKWFSPIIKNYPFHFGVVKIYQPLLAQLNNWLGFIFFWFCPFYFVTHMIFTSKTEINTYVICMNTELWTDVLEIPINEDKEHSKLR